MGTNSIKEKDMLHGGKPSSYGRKARRVMRRELTKVADYNKAMPSNHNGRLILMTLETNVSLRLIIF